VQDVGSFGPVTWTSTPRVVQDVQGWIANPASNFGWAVIGNETTLATAKEFNSREGFSGRPALTITYSVPEPGWLGMISIMGLGAVARRGRRCNMC
jgi:hypothetical protein